LQLSNDKQTLGTPNFFLAKFLLLMFWACTAYFFLKLRQLAATIDYVPNGRLFFLSMGQVKKSLLNFGLVCDDF